MSFDLYSMSAAISIRRIWYIFSKYPSSSDRVAVTVVLGGSMRCPTKSRTCDPPGSGSACEKAIVGACQKGCSSNRWHGQLLQR